MSRPHCMVCRPGRGQNRFGCSCYRRYRVRPPGRRVQPCGLGRSSSPISPISGSCGRMATAPGDMSATRGEASTQKPGAGLSALPLNQSRRQSRLPRLFTQLLDGKEAQMPDYCPVAAPPELESHVRWPQSSSLLLQRHAGAHDVRGRYAFSSSHRWPHMNGPAVLAGHITCSHPRIW